MDDETLQEQLVSVMGPLLADDRLLAAGRAMGVDLTDRGQLVAAGAVGLTVALWRNTVVEEIHAGAVDGGFRPRDVDMLRMNASTCDDVAEVLDAVLPEDITSPGTHGPVPDRPVPEHLMAVIDLLSEPDRLLTIGPSIVTAGEVLGEQWPVLVEDQLRKLNVTLAVADGFGSRTSLWFSALSGAGYAGTWWPLPYFADGVARLRTLVASGDPAVWNPEVPSTLWAPTAADERFWDVLTSEPYLLDDEQARWVLRSLLGDHVRAAREAARETLGGRPQDEPSVMVWTF